MTYFVDGVASLATMRGLSGLTPGECLRAVWLAYSANGAHSQQVYATAMDAYAATGDRHPGDTHPPAGVPVWFGSGPGDVGISSGNGRGVFVWWSGVHEVTIPQRAAEIGRPYLGWTGRFMTDNVIITPAPADTTASTSGGFLMALTDTQQQAVYDAIFGTNGGLGSLPDGINLPTAIQRIYSIVSQPVERTINGSTVTLSQIQDNADSNTMIRALTAAVGALQASVSTLAAASGADPAAIQAAAQKGAAAALANLTLVPQKQAA